MWPRGSGQCFRVGQVSRVTPKFQEQGGNQYPAMPYTFTCSHRVPMVSALKSPTVVESRGHCWHRHPSVLHCCPAASQPSSESVGAVGHAHCLKFWITHTLESLAECLPATAASTNFKCPVSVSCYVHTCRLL